jgi:hypothetical protein
LPAEVDANGKHWYQCPFCGERKEPLQEAGLSLLRRDENGKKLSLDAFGDNPSPSDLALFGVRHIDQGRLDGSNLLQRKTSLDEMAVQKHPIGHFREPKIQASKCKIPQSSRGCLLASIGRGLSFLVS